VRVWYPFGRQPKGLFQKLFKTGFRTVGTFEGTPLKIGHSVTSLEFSPPELLTLN